MSETAPPPEAVEIFQRFVNRPPLGPQELIEKLNEYLKFVDKVHQVNPHIDRELAHRIGGVLKQLVAVATAQNYGYLQAAALYFIEDEDASGDLVKPDGFDDDLLVVNAVARHLGHPELVI